MKLFAPKFSSKYYVNDDSDSLGSPRMEGRKAVEVENG